MNNNPNLQLKKIFKDQNVKTVMISFVTMLLTLGIISLVAWHYRGAIVKMLASDYPTEIKTLGDKIETSSGNINDTSSVNALLTKSEDTVVNAVKTAKPAVVSIVVSKEVPKYDISYNQNSADPFNNLFPEFFFQTPSYTPNGTEKKKIGSGSGFLISSDGLIVTNRHVVDDKTATYEVLLNNGKTYPAKVLARDGMLDVALIKINVTGLQYLHLGDSDQLEVGQSVIAIGNALGEFKNSVSVGVVSGLSRSIVAGDNFGQSERLDKVIQTDAAINPGNSGGPLLNLKGEVIGINVAVVQGSSNVGFALPINDTKNSINSVIHTGKIVRPYIGVRYIPITPELKTKNNLSVDYGVLVQRGQTINDLAVVPGSPADKAGIKENDIILEIDGIKINEDQNLSFLVRNKKVGDYISMKVLSKGLERNVSVRLEAAPDNV